MSARLARLLVLLGAACAAGLLRAGEEEIATLLSADYFAVGGAGYNNTISAGELAFRKIYSEKNNLEQFVVVYGRGSNVARMYALAGFYKLNRPLYDHLKTVHAESEAPVPRIVCCEVYKENLGSLMTRLEKGDFDALFPRSPEVEK